MLPKLNKKRAQFVLTKIDEFLAWERRNETERDARFVELGGYLCEVRAGQYWRLETREHTDDLPTTVRTVRELLDDIVARQLIADVPLCT